MKTFLPAFLERMFPRVFSALLMLMVAASTSPYAVGIYAWVALAYTASQAALDAPVRQVIIRAVTEADGARFLRKYRVVAPCIAGFVILGTILILHVAGIVTNWGMAISLMPFAFAPAFTAQGVRAVGVLQATNRWNTLARGQLVASIVSVALAIPILMLTHSLLGPCLQTLVAEIVFAGWVRNAANFPRRSIEGHVAVVIPSPNGPSIMSDMIGMAAYSLLAWGQGQAERVFIGSFAGPALLGTYSTANTIGRAPGDALGASTANIARTAIAQNHTPEDIRSTMERTMMKTMLLAAGAPISATLFALILHPVLGTAWQPSLRVVPILSITAFPSVMSWSASVLQMKSGRAARSMWAPLLGIACGGLIGLVAVHSLVLACYAVILRELVVVAVGFALVRRYAPWRAFGVCVGVVVVLTALSVVVIGW